MHASQLSQTWAPLYLLALASLSGRFSLLCLYFGEAGSGLFDSSSSCCMLGGGGGGNSNSREAAPLSGGGGGGGGADAGVD